MEPSSYYSACVSDACACDSGGDCECFCTAVAAYAKACSAAGVCIPWRSPKICRESYIYLQISAERVGKFHSMIPVQHILFKVYHGTIVIIFALILANFCLETFWLVSSVYS